MRIFLLSFKPLHCELLRYTATKSALVHERKVNARINGGIAVTHADRRPPHSETLGFPRNLACIERATIPRESCEAVCVTSGHAGKQQTATCLRSTARTSLHCTLHTATNRSIDVYFHALPLHFRLAVRQLRLHVQSTKHEHARLRYSPVSVHW